MKTYLLTSALLLVAGTALATASTVTVNSSVYVMGSGGSSASVTSGPYDLYNGITFNGASSGRWTSSNGMTINESTAYPIHTADKAYYSNMSLASFSNLYTSETLNSSAYTYSLSSFSIVTRPDGEYADNTVYCVISDGTNSVTSGQVTYSYSGGSSSTYGIATFSFTDTTALDVTASWTVSYYYYSSGTYGSGDASNYTFGVGAFLPSYSSSSGGYAINGTSYTDNISNAYSQVYSLTLTATAIPEPSAFGLLAGVGALALVATRRRRRA